MELFETYDNHESIHDILRECLDDEMEVVRAMHNYEMKTIYMEAAKNTDEDEFDPVMEAAGDVIERLKASAKTFFEKLKGWIKSAVMAITNNAKAYQKFVEEHRHGIDTFVSKKLDFEPSGYKVHGFTLSGQIAHSNNDVAHIRELAEKAMKGDRNAYEQLKYISAVDDKSQLYRAQLAKTYTKDDLSDDKIFRRELMKRFADEDDVITSVDGSVLRFFENFLKSGYADCIKEYKKQSQKIDEEYKKTFKLFAELEREIKQGSNTGGSVTKDEIVVAVNKVWNVTKRSHSDSIIAFNTYREATAKCASIGKKVIVDAVKLANIHPGQIPTPDSPGKITFDYYEKQKQAYEDSQQQ